jgi:hypothetical protein
MSEVIREVGVNYPIGPCELPLLCSCGTIITNENVNNSNECSDGCEVCDYCGVGKCPTCGEHWHCGGCI